LITTENEALADMGLSYSTLNIRRQRKLKNLLLCSHGSCTTTTSVRGKGDNKQDKEAVVSILVALLDPPDLKRSALQSDNASSYLCVLASRPRTSKLPHAKRCTNLSSNRVNFDVDGIDRSDDCGVERELVGRMQIKY
jgi:hypothetical protein